MPKSSTKKYCNSWICRIVVIIIFTPISLVIFNVCYTLLLCNEENAIYRDIVLEKAEDMISNIDSQLVHITSYTFANGTLTDDKFNIFVPHAIKLRRTVKMCQWEETVTDHHDEEGSYTHTTYDYSKVWSEYRINSDNFEYSYYHNPSMPLRSNELVAQQVYLGELTLPPSIIAKIYSYEHLKADVQVPDKVYNRKSHIHKDIYYLGNDPDNNQIGDLWVKFEVINSKEIISVIAKQVDLKLSAYRMQPDDLNIPDYLSTKKYEHKSNYIELFGYGELDIKTIFLNARIDDFTSRLSARIVMFPLIFVGIYVIFIILGRLGSFLSCLNILAEWGRNWISLAFLAIAISFISIAIIWLKYAPLIAIVLILIAIFFLRYLKAISLLSEVPKLSLEPVLNPERNILHKN
ncbi:TMEM43 family protein [Candidatus Halobeggiatoa sp. HSG11]|nr:TMEM43 family protein [Candidatus Halobeggiatoa sp. HSG11]